MAEAQPRLFPPLCLEPHCLLPSVNFRFGFLTGMTLLNPHRKSWTNWYLVGSVYSLDYINGNTR